ncbi:TonB family protein [Synechococcus moorigangaii CMS01]|nr:TonB family protein [Synechococcus moorigangaii CMS01]
MSKPITLLNIALLGLLGFTPLLQASTPSASQIVSLRGDRLFLQHGNQRPNPAQVGNRLQNQSQALIVPGNNTSLARLAFLGGGQSYHGLLLQAGPDQQQTQYRFPCAIAGGKVTLSWHRGNQRGCANGVRLGGGEGAAPKQQTKQNLKEQPLAQTPSIATDLTIQPHSEGPILLRAVADSNLQAVETLQGEIRITSAQDPQGFILRAGEGYYRFGNDQGQIESFDPNGAIANSPDLQEFLNPDTWQDGQLPSPVTQDISNHLIALHDPNQGTVINPSDDPELSATCQAEVAFYLASLRATMGNTWQPPYPPSPGIWRTEVTYFLTKEGRVQDLQVVKSSGANNLDQAALSHVRSLEQRFEPFPSCYPYESLPVDNNFTVRYQ